MEIAQLGKDKWLKEIELFVTQSGDGFILIAMKKTELKNPLFMQRAIQAFVNHIQEAQEEQTSSMLRRYFRNWLNSKNGSLKDIINGTKTGDTEEDRATGRNNLKETLTRRYS